MRIRRLCVPAVLCFASIFVPYVFASDTTSPTSFTQLATLTPSDINGAASWFGFTVAISGNAAVVGAPFANNNAGAVYVFVKPASGWADMTQTAELSPSDGTTGIEFG